LITEKQYVPGDRFVIINAYNWNNYEEGARDFTVQLYSKMDLKLTDAFGKENQIHMDIIENFVNKNNDTSYNQDISRPTSL